MDCGEREIVIDILELQKKINELKIYLLLKWMCG